LEERGKILTKQKPPRAAFSGVSIQALKPRLSSGTTPTYEFRCYHAVPEAEVINAAGAVAGQFVATQDGTTLSFVDSNGTGITCRFRLRGSRAKFRS
jgi:hypothetical protein